MLENQLKTTKYTKNWIFTELVLDWHPNFLYDPAVCEALFFYGCPTFVKSHTA